MDRTKVLEKLHALIAEGAEVLRTRHAPPRGMISGELVDESQCQKWATSVVTCFKTAFGDADHHVKQAEKLLLTPWSADEAQRLLAVVKSARESVADEVATVIGGTTSADPMAILTQVFDRFHQVVKQLRDRRMEGKPKQPRPTLKVTDEYDVQDLLQALLRLYFDDIRPEEWTPGVGGGSNRIDLVLWPEFIAIETKMTRPTLDQRTLVDELVVDIRHYKEHPRCKTLVFFVYDPAEIIPNPTAVETDLKEHTGGLDVRVFVRSR
jgi:hypothetical protein